MVCVIDCNSSQRHVVALSLPDGASEVQSQVEGLPSSSAGFERAQPGRSFSFPLDHGPHDEYQTEWWYYTGNLSSADGRKFGYQLTFFRRAMTPVEQRQERQSIGQPIRYTWRILR
jgi:predicted secreted hydrolase